MQPSTSKPYYAAGMAAFIIWGFIPFPLKALAAYPSGQILFYRIAFSVVLLLLITVLFRRKAVMATWHQVKTTTAPDRRSVLGFTFLGAILLTINWLAFIYVVNHISVQAGSFSYLLCPIITALLGFLLLKEKLRINQWLAIGMSALSCTLIGSGDIASLLLSLFVALSYAFYLITQRILKGYDKTVLLLLQLILSFSFIAPFYSYFTGDSTAALDAHFFGTIALLSAAFTVLPLFLNLFALKELTSGTVGIMMYINPVINFLIAFLYFDEQSTSLKITAYLIIFISVIVYNLQLKGRKKTGNGMVIPTIGTGAVVK